MPPKTSSNNNCRHVQPCAINIDIIVENIARDRTVLQSSSSVLDSNRRVWDRVDRDAEDVLCDGLPVAGRDLQSMVPFSLQVECQRM
jgi:hypothetical protein